jgi:chaperonin GroES
LLPLFCKIASKLFKIISGGNMNFQPLGKRILVERLDEATTTSTGIIIPDSAKEKPSEAKVVAVSDEVKNVAIGDKVIFSKYSGNEVTLEGAEYLILEIDDIFGIVK